MSTRPRPPVRALVITAVAAVVAGIGVAALLVANTNKPRPVDPADYRPFRAGAAVSLERAIARAPVFFPDPRRGTRGFFLDRLDGTIVALHVLVPGRARCPAAYELERRRYVDCDRHPIDPHVLARFAVTATGTGDERVIDVDLRTIMAPPSRPAA